VVRSGVGRMGDMRTLPVKFRDHVINIDRIKPSDRTRLDKTRLDKNERISAFPSDFWQDVLGGITQEIVQSCPETWFLYKKLSSALSIDMDRILLTSGSEMAIRSCIEAFVPPGGKVVYPEPTFAMVPVYLDLYRALKCPVGYDSKLNLKAGYLMDSIDHETSLVILANPNSPTGTSVSNRVVEEILQRASRFRVPVLVDEAYYGFCRHTAFDLMDRHPNLVVTRSFSKVAGMAGLRVGYAMGNADVVSLLEKFRPMYEVNSIGIHFALKILDNWHIAEEYGRKTIVGRDCFAAFLAEQGFHVINTETNFVHVDFGELKESVLAGIEAEGILVRGMLNIHGFENYTRFSVGPWEVMSRVAESIRSLIEKI